MHFFIQDEIKKLATLLVNIQKDQRLLETVDAIAKACVKALQQEGKILFAGNGGSAADSQHLAAELACRLRYHRPGLPGIALTTDTSALTAIGNDYAFDYIFARQVEALGRAGDVFIGISTSGKSPNILQALKEARAKKMLTIGFTGATGTHMDELCDFVLHVPSTETAKIQECHILLGHIICAIIEETLYGADYNPARKRSEEVA